MGWFGSSSSSQSNTIEPGQAPSRAQRALCWKNRDEYFACLDQNGILQADDGELGDKKGVCADFRKAYEGACGKSWVDYFNKRRVLEIRSQKTLEAAAKQHAEAAAANKR